MRDTRISGDMPHILAVDDDDRIRGLLQRFLTQEGFLVLPAADAASARRIIENFDVDAMVLDVMMPEQDGLSLLAELRQKYSVPTIMLTALGDIEDRLKGFETGADDYLPKPFEPKELLFRLQAILRRVPRKQVLEREVTIGPWVYDREQSELIDQEQPASALKLTAVEVTLLDTLLSGAGQVLSREILARKCGLTNNIRSVDVQITRLRKKLEKDASNPRFLQTVRGKGYILKTDS